MYDYAHPLSDAIEGITHSLCTLEFEDHRPLYDWLVDNVDGLPGRPIQREFARLNLTYTVMSKRKLLRLVKENHVSGWDDPRMPTLCGIRRRGYTPEAIRAFCKGVGVTKFKALTDMAVLEHAMREDLNKTARAPHGRAAPDQARHRKLSRRPGRGDRGRRTIPRIPARARAGAALPRALHRAR